RLNTSATRTWRAWRRWCTTARWRSRTRSSAPSAMFRSPPIRTGPAFNESLEVLQPPVAASRFEARVPAAGDVQDDDRHGPDEIQERETPGVAVGSGRVAHRVIGEEPRVHAPGPDLRDDEGERVNERDVQHV